VTTSRNTKSYYLEGIEKPKDSITLRAVFFFVLFIFVMIVGTLFFLRYSAYSSFSEYYKQKGASNPNINVKAPLKGEDRLTVFISESQLVKLWSVAGDDFVLKRVELKINDGNIEISGKTSDHFWALPVVVSITPAVENDKLFFKISKISAYGVSPPSNVSDRVTKEIMEMTQKSLFLSGEKNIKVKEAAATPGQLYVTYERLES